MHKIDHAAILFAYLSRITRADMENILERDKVCLHAAMNLGNSAQLSAQAGMYAAVANAVNNLIKHDVELIEHEVKRST
jgi:hypothetical protein